ncbi:MAG: hypothetical protein ACRD8U_02335 [Pyrinomonadaceae bacterium]
MQAPISTDGLRRRSPDHAIILALAFILAQASVMYTCYWAGHTEGVRQSGGFLTEFPYTLSGFHIVISFCLGVCVVGLWLRRGWGLIVSSVSLVSVLVTYGYWHFRTVEYLSDLRDNAPLYKRVQEETGIFHGATKWDFVVLAFVAIFVVWHLFRLTKVALKRRSGSATV